MVLILALCSYWTWRYIGHAVLCLMRPIGLGKTLSEAVLLVRPTLSFLPSGLSAAPEAEPWHMLLPVLARTLWLVTTECCILRVCCVFVSPGGCCHLCRVERWHQGWWGHLFCVSVPRCSSRSLAFFFFFFLAGFFRARPAADLCPGPPGGMGVGGRAIYLSPAGRSLVGRGVWNFRGRWKPGKVLAFEM